MQPRLLLLDGHSLAYRAFHALPEENFTTSTGQATNAVYGFTSMLLNVLRDEAPTHIAVAFDVSRTTFRTERFPEYKATRSASPASFRGQVDLIREVLRALNINMCEIDGFEADDIIATMTREACEQGFRVDILTGDRDSFQLVSDSVTVLYPKKGVSELQRTTPDLVVEKYGLRPDQYADYAALRGDPSDNLPGIPGVGEKTAAKWLQQFGTLESLLEHATEITGKVGEALRNAVEQVRLNRELTQLVSTVAVPLEIPQLAVSEPNMSAVTQLFDTLQFRTLLNRLPAAKSAQTQERGSHTHALEPTLVVSIAESWQGWLESAAGVAGLHLTDTTLSFGWPNGSAFVVEWAQIGADVRAHIAGWLADISHGKAAYSTKAVHRQLALRGLTVAGFRHDICAAQYLISAGQPSLQLPDLARQLLGYEFSERDDQPALFADASAQVESDAESAVAVAAVAPILEKQLHIRDALTLLKDMEIPVAGVLAAMEDAGIAVDVRGLQELERDYAAVATDVETRAHAIVGKPFNLSSPKQLQEILFVERSLPHTKKIKTGYSTDVDALTWLSETTQDPLPAVLLEYRDVSRLRQTITGLINAVAPDMRVHTTFQQFVAATGRLSSTDPNLQNIPVRTREGQRIREMFIVGPGYETLLTADYSQIELRLMAHLSEDEGLRTAFLAGEDIHTTVASGVFGVAPDEVDAGMRRKVKAMSYGLAYGLSAFGLAQQLRMEPAEARQLMEEYFGRFRGVQEYLSRVVDEARKVGYTQTMFGRRRYLPDLSSDNRQRRDIAERMALNAPIQGTAADIVKIAMIRASHALAGTKSRLLLQVHDELVVEVAPGETELVTELIRDAMQGATQLSVPLDVNIGLGKNWDEAAH